VATASADGTARLFEVASGKETARLAHDNTVWSVAFSPDGRLVATASLDGTARLFEAASGKETARLAHDASVNSVAFSPDGRLVATASLDGTARLFEAASGKETARLAHDDTVNSVAFSPDGAAILSASADHTARLWRVWPTLEDLVNAAKRRASRCLSLAQREQYFLPDAPPLWCVERRLWPYENDDWQAWLTARKSGHEVALPQSSRQ
jgi:WD40 repeat protein